MELPHHIRHLYRHWEKHAGASAQGAAIADLRSVIADDALRAGIEAFVRERLVIWEKKIAGQPAPYTGDPILSAYRFCNVFRELDRQTIEFHEMLNPLRGDFSLWLLNMFYCRMVARPETVRAVGLLSFDAAENEALTARLATLARPRYGTPYVFPVSAIMGGPTPTRELFIGRHLPKVMRVVAAEIEQWKDMPVSDGIERVLPLFGYNLRFLWTEVLIDTAYQFPERIDLFGRFPVGPGALPTMRRIDRDADPSLLAARLAEARFDTGLAVDGVPLRLSAENWEGIGCEFRKYTNLGHGRGRKRLYRPTGE